MKRVVNIKFSWKEAIPTADGPSYVLTTTIGVMPLDKTVQLFSDRRGFYTDYDNPIVFTTGFSAAKRRVEDQLTAALIMSA